MKDEKDALMLAWTTCESGEDAKRLADSAVDQNLAACVQISGPITSVYRWKGKVQRDQEYRLLFKCPESRLEALHSWLTANHPYETPQFYAVKAGFVDTAYLDWATDL
ncbi:MAG: divalent-cation tolerance protein CutA [Puniceicoccaceae bacterium]